MTQYRTCTNKNHRGPDLEADCDCQDGTHVVGYISSVGVKFYVYGDGLVTEKKDMALRFTKADAEIYMDNMERRTNARRQAEGMAPLSYSVEEI